MLTVMFHLRIAGSFRDTFNIPYPAMYTRFISVMSSVVDIKIVRLMNVKCAVDYNFIASICIQTLWPLALTLCIGFGSGVFMFVGRRMKLKFMRRLASWGVSIILYTSFLVYPGLSVMLFRYFKCVPVGGGMSDVLLVDMRIECESVLYQR